MSKHNQDQEHSNQPIQGFCPKCGRNLELDDVGTIETPIKKLREKKIDKIATILDNSTLTGGYMSFDSLDDLAEYILKSLEKIDSKKNNR